MGGNRFVDVNVGNIVSSQGRRYKITHLLGVNSVLGKDVESGKVERLRVEDLTSVTTAEFGNPNTVVAAVGPDLEDISDKDWGIAQQRMTLIRPLLEDPLRTREMAERIAAKADVHVSTLYKWMRLFLDNGHVSALIPLPRGRKEGSKFLEEEQEAIIDSVIEDLFLQPQRATPQEVIDEVNQRCKKAGIAKPHGNTVRNRIKKIPDVVAFRRRGQRDKAERYTPIQGHFPGASYPLAVVQIDHTESDLIVVDEYSRRPIGRPWSTLAIDCNTRMVVGVYVSLDPPSGVAAGQCLARGILPKAEYLAELEVPGDWPVWGKMACVHCDNAREFRGEMLKGACDQYKIDLTLRPKKVPRYGGHIERLMGVKNKELKKLPGATFSSPKKREGYDSDKKSALTLREFEQHLVDYIVNVYHQRKHSELGTSPMKCWEQGVLGDLDKPGIGLPELPADPMRIHLDFMPFVERTVQRNGINIDNVEYFHEVLIPWINAADPEHPKEKRKFIVRRDPRDISAVYFYDPQTKQYYVIPYRDLSHPAISLWELRAAQEWLREQGNQDIDERRIFEAVERMRQRVAEAVHKTKKARRDQARIDRAGKLAAARSDSSTPPITVPTSAATPTSPVPDVDIFSLALEPIEDREVRS